MCAGSRTGIEQREVAVGPVQLPGRLAFPQRPHGLVLFAHGSGSGRLSPRNVEVAQALEQSGFATLLFDLLTATEGSDRERVFDIPLLGQRLSEATEWARQQPPTKELPFGYFGASTGAAAALVAAAERGSEIAAVVSRGGRPDLAGESLARVVSPTLLIVGGEDPVVIDLNRRAQAALRAPNELVIVPGAGHLFEEPGTMQAVIELARGWFHRQMVRDQ
jgi:putative phosphoribosyl transferase